MKRVTTIELPVVKPVVDGAKVGFVRTETNLKVGGRLSGFLTDDQLAETEKLTAYYVALAKIESIKHDILKVENALPVDTKKLGKLKAELPIIEETIEEMKDYVPSLEAIKNISIVLAAFVQPTIGRLDYDKAGNLKVVKVPFLLDGFTKLYGLYCAYARKWADTPEFTKERKESLSALTEETINFVNNALNGVLTFKFTMPMVEQISKRFCPLAKTKKNGTSVWETTKNGSVVLQNAIFTLVFFRKEEIQW